MVATRNRRTAARIVAVAVAATLAHSGVALAGPSPVGLGTAAQFGVLGGSGLTNTGRSVIVGDVGSSPTHSETGFAPCPAADCVELTGTNHNVADPNDAVTQQAKSDLVVAYDDAFGRPGGTPITAPLGGGSTLVPGVYTSAADIFVGGDLTLDAGGDPNAVFIFQARTGTLVTAAGITSGIPNTRVLLSNGAQACNVFWQVGSSATIGTFTQFTGNVLALQSATVNTSATVDGGRVLARNGAVTLDTNTIRQATCATPEPDPEPTPTPTPTPTTPAPSPTPTTPTATTPTATTPTPTTPGDTTTAPSPVPSPTETGGPTLPTSIEVVPSSGSPSTGAPTSVVKPGKPKAGAAARVTGPSGPVRGSFDVSATGKAISTVSFYVDGERVRTVNAKPGRTVFRVTINPRGQSRRVHRVTVRITYTAASGRASSTSRFTYRRVATPRAPQFTG